MRITRSLPAPVTFAAAMIALTAGIAVAETTGRFTMTPSGDGFIRLDTVTGAVSECRSENERWTCKAVADDALALADEIDRLAKENKALKQELEAARGQLPSDAPGEHALPQLPSDADIDRTMDFIEKLMRKFKGLAKDLGKEEAPGTPL